jgi:hypothetical protein
MECVMFDVYWKGALSEIHPTRGAAFASIRAMVRAGYASLADIQHNIAGFVIVSRKSGARWVPVASEQGLNGYYFKQV